MTNTLQTSQQLNEACLCQWAQCDAFANYESNPWQSEYPYFISRDHYIQMADFIALFSTMTESQVYRSLVHEILPGIVSHESKNKGVFDGFDFHITAAGPKLIEVNTNAGGAYLNRGFSQQNDDFEERLWQMFAAEYLLQYSQLPLRTIVILDDNPEDQFLYQEMVQFKNLFESKGIQGFVLSPQQLELNAEGLFFENNKVDLIYNRHTDFYLHSPALEKIKQAYLQDQIVLTPNPAAYGYRADKRVLALISDTVFLAALGLSEKLQLFIRQIVPETRLVNADNAEQFWRERKQWFFKPVSGFGSRGVYRGSKLTKKTWQHIVTADYVAQLYIPPAKRMVAVEGKEQLLKSDVRHYVYDGDILMSLSRLYNGQATNLRTRGGGFSPLVVI